VHRILTVGHSNHPVERLLALLHQHGVQVLVDVRSQPYSRFAPQFNRENLQASVTAAGLQYLFFGEELGGRRQGTIISTDERVQAYKQVAAEPSFQAGIETVLERAKNDVVALLCAEEDPTECHRRVWVTRALLEAGAEVAHLRAVGHVSRVDEDRALKRLAPPEGHQLSLFDS
jgi:uncharacterized protein (DUF488 family)